MGKSEPQSILARAADVVIVGVVYYAIARLSLRLALVGESVTPLWPPTGIALVAFLWFGRRAWPGIAIAAFLVNLPVSPSPVAAAGIAVGNTVAPLVAHRLLEANDFRVELDRLRDALVLVFVAALGSMTLSATAGTLSLVASNAIELEDFGATWSVWWTGDAMGILAIAPFLLGVRQIRIRGLPPTKRILEAAALYGSLGFAAFSIHQTDRPGWVVVFPLLGWAAWRFRQLGAGPAALIVILMATWAAAQDEGPFAGEPLLQKMVMLQVFNAAVAFTSFFFAAIVSERERAVAEQRRSIERERETQARLYEREHRIAETLQRSLLPERLPDLLDVEAAARYLPASGEVDVGGDWYDIIPLQNGRLGLGIGDMAGHGLSAAAAMGQVRTAFRAYVLEGLSPAATLDRLNRLLRELLPGAMATLACAELDPESGTMRIARAGHPPPIVRGAKGDVRLVEGGQAPPLGVVPGAAYQEAETQLAVGSTFFFYTDGLVERRRESLDLGMRRLQGALSSLPDDLESACDRILRDLVGSNATDDAVLLAVRRVPLVGRPMHLSFPAQPERLAGIRRILGRWLRQNGASEREVADVLVACSEACANVIQHAYVSTEGAIEIDGSVEGGAVGLAVRDFGSWMPRASSSADANRGSRLMRGLMDTVDVVTTSGGTTVRMRKRIRGGGVDG